MMKLIIFASINEAEILSKILQKFYYEWQIVLNFGKNGLSYKLEHRALISQFYPQNLVTCYRRLGECAESGRLLD